MSQTYGIESHDAPDSSSHRKPIRYVVLIDAGGSPVAMFTLASHELVSEVDAGTEEVAAMIAGIEPAIGALDPVWDGVLGGHHPDERKRARVYTLTI
ncbi:MAG: hypothetical protein ABIR55_14475 [Burkholderiaceae bacterium]